MAQRQADDFSIGAWVRTEREARGWSQADLVYYLRAELGVVVSQGMVSHWERDQEPSGRHLLTLIRMFGCPPVGVPKPLRQRASHKGRSLASKLSPAA